MIWPRVVFLTIYYTIYIKNASCHNGYSIHLNRSSILHSTLVPFHTELLKHFSRIILFILLRLSLSIYRFLYCYEKGYCCPLW